MTKQCDLIGCCQGDWVDDERHGEGQFAFCTREEYDGKWAADRISESSTCIPCMYSETVYTCTYIAYLYGRLFIWGVNVIFMVSFEIFHTGKCISAMQQPQNLILMSILLLKATRNFSRKLHPPK